MSGTIQLFPSFAFMA